MVDMEVVRLEVVVDATCRCSNGVCRMRVGLLSL